MNLCPLGGQCHLAVDRLLGDGCEPNRRRRSLLWYGQSGLARRRGCGRARRLPVAGVGGCIASLQHVPGRLARSQGLPLAVRGAHSIPATPTPPIGPDIVTNRTSSQVSGAHFPGAEPATGRWSAEVCAGEVAQADGAGGDREVADRGDGRAAEDLVVPDDEVDDEWAASTTRAPSQAERWRPASRLAGSPVAPGLDDRFCPRRITTWALIPHTVSSDASRYFGGLTIVAVASVDPVRDRAAAIAALVRSRQCSFWTSRRKHRLPAQHTHASKARRLSQSGRRQPALET